MKSRRPLIALSVLLLTIGVVAVPRVWDRVHTLYPTPETESAFLKNYTPTNALNPFNNGQASYSGGRTAGAGQESVTHTATFEGYFALCSEKFVPLMNALKDDVAAQLVGNGAHILSQIGEAPAGFHFDYGLGKSVGSVTIPPLELPPHVGGTLSRSMSQPNCKVEVRTRINITEEWFPKEPGVTQVSVNDSIQ